MGLNFIKNKVELQEISEDTKGLIDVNPSTSLLRRSSHGNPEIVEYYKFPDVTFINKIWKNKP
jgi:hypothetical protein